MGFQDRLKGVYTYGPFNSDGDLTVAVGRAEGEIIITDAYVLNSASAATHATAYITMSIINMGTGAAGTTVVATASTSQTGGTALTANLPFDLTITAANKTLTDNQIIGFQRDEQTTDAVAQAAAQVVVHYTQVGPA